jgi:hypothetical protein
MTAFGASTYSWSPSGSLNTSTGATVIATPLTTTTYTVTGTATNGCQSTGTKTITVMPAPDPTITPAGYVSVCEHDSVYLKAQPGYTGYVWKFYNVVVSPISSSLYPTATGGYYTLTVTDNNGCSSTTSAPTIITVISRPVSVITRTPGTTILDAGAGFSSYQWYHNGSAIPGANTRYYTATSVGSYTVRITETSPLSCDAMSVPYELRSLSIGSAVPADAITLYPNPTLGVLHINSPVPVSAAVISMDGKQVFSGESVKEINMSAWPDGVYRVVLHDKNGAYLKVEKITKLSK